MSNPVFANVVVGVTLQGTHLKKFLTEYERVKATLPEEDEDGDPFYPTAVVTRMDAAVLDAIRKAVGAPADAAFFHTGSEDEILTGSALGADEWMVGYSVHQLLPLVRDKWGSKMQKRVEWLSWCTGSA